MINKITVNNKEFSIKSHYIKLNSLYFLIGNPRIVNKLKWNHWENECEYFKKDELYSDRNQDKAYQALLQEKEYKSIKNRIVENGGLIDPLIVKRRPTKNQFKDPHSWYVVLEGNTRLAAIKELAMWNPEYAEKFDSVRCLIIGDCDDFTMDDAFSLIAQYHITEKKEWDKYSKCYFIHQAMLNTGKSFQEVKQSFFIRDSKFNQAFKAYLYVRNNEKATIKNFNSYFELFFLEKFIDLENPEIKERVISCVEDGKIGKSGIKELKNIIVKNPEITKDIVDQFVYKKISISEILRYYKSSVDIMSLLNKIETTIKPEINFESITTDLKLLKDLKKQFFILNEKICEAMNNMVEKRMA